MRITHKGLVASIAVLFAFGVAACTSTDQPAGAPTSPSAGTTTAGQTGSALITNVVTYLNARGAQTPATVVLPDGQGPFPLVVLAHGYGGNRDEGFGFIAVAERLATRGIASIRMDFPGCGDSTESFQLNTLTNMEADVLAAINFAKSSFSILPDKVGFFGYDMGGRVGLELVAADAYDFQALAFLAPTASTPDLKERFGGVVAWNAMKSMAATDGFVAYTTAFGEVREMSIEWFTELETTPTGIEELAAANAKPLSPVIVVFGSDDKDVNPSVSQAVADAFDASEGGVVVADAAGDGHNYGFYSDKISVRETVVLAVANGFTEALS